MSAALAWELTPTPDRMPLRTRGPRLRLVLPAERAVPPLRVVTRINRRGRLLVTLAVLAAGVTLALTFATSVMASAPLIDHATTVSAGETLSEVAAAQLPGLPIDEGVARIQLANGLNTSQVHAGQSLLIPAMP